MSIALSLTNALVGLGGIAAGVGFSFREKQLMEDLDKKSKKLQASVETASNLYDHTYYLVAVNLDRCSKALDKLPSDFVKKVQDQIKSDISDQDWEKAVKTISYYMGLAGQGVAVIGSILDMVEALRKRKASGKTPTEPPEEGHFDDVPLDGEQPKVPPETETSFSESSTLSKFTKGVNIAGVVFGVAGLVATIGLGAWTVIKLENAISDVDKKQAQVDKFHKAMENALDPMVKSAGLPAKSYDQLITMAGTWKKVSENFDSYEKSFYYAIKGFFMKKSVDDIKSLIAKESDPGKPFPEDGYPLAKTLADDIKDQFDHKKSDKEVVAFFAQENPKIGLRFVFNEFFVSSLRFEL